MPVILRARVHAEAALRDIERMGNPVAYEPFFAEGTGRAAIRLQGVMRKALNDMIYSLPEGRYQRTGTLMRSAHAAHPRANHSGDQGRARAGEDLAATNPLSVVQRRRTTFVSHIGSWIGYAAFVHQGAGRGARVPKPFAAPVGVEAPSILHQEIQKATTAFLRTFRAGAR